MSITVVYRNGAFEPLEAVSIPEETVLRIEVLQSGDAVRIPPPGSFAARHGLGLFGAMAPSFNEDEFEELAEE